MTLFEPNYFKPKKKKKKKSQNKTKPSKFETINEINKTNIKNREGFILFKAKILKAYLRSSYLVFHILVPLLILSLGGCV